MEALIFLVALILTICAFVALFRISKATQQSAAHLARIAVDVAQLDATIKDELERRRR